MLRRSSSALDRLALAVASGRVGHAAGLALDLLAAARAVRRSRRRPDEPGGGADAGTSVSR